MKQAIFITGIDTDAGKSFATGWLARHLAQKGEKVITQKFIQTGCTDSSEDIEIHRQIMGTGLLPCDTDHTTCPLIFTYPASAQLAAQIDGREIDLSIVDSATERLLLDYDTVLIEGAGGLMVPITDTFMAIDYAHTRKLPVALVTNARLGSINHTVLSIEALKARSMELRYILFNHHFDSADSVIAADTRAWIERYLHRVYPHATIIDIPTIKL